MTKNMGKIDRGVRLLAAVALVAIAFGTEVASVGVLHWLALGVAAVFTLTAIVGNCPLYSIVGIKTCRAS
ncbi:MAG: DUF2892 domain-containing protein [Roseicyclus sp.]|jgi:hypothetical protein